jgi:hypothetical protein
MLLLLLLIPMLTILFTFALIFFPRNPLLNWLTRPFRAWLWMRWSTMDYRQAYASLRLMDIRDRRLHQ